MQFKSDEKQNDSKLPFFFTSLSQPAENPDSIKHIFAPQPAMFYLTEKGTATQTSSTLTHRQMVLLHILLVFTA